jgi:hypothetical protein
MQLAACSLQLAASPRSFFAFKWTEGRTLKTRADTGVENKLDGASAVHVEPGV